MPNAWPDPASYSTDTTTWGEVPGTDNERWNNVKVATGSNGYRLATEAQWEYAARGGEGSPGNYTYSGSNTVGEVAWYIENSGEMTHEVGKKTANGLGLYDMSGNVYEWVWDRYANNYSYTGNDRPDPTGASSGSDRVLRGGSWVYSAGHARSAFRGSIDPSRRHVSRGFRLVRPSLTAE